MAHSDKRVVVQYPSGLWQIIGHTDIQPDPLLKAGDEGAFNLVAMRRSYYLYRPVMSPSQAMQRLNRGTYENQEMDQPPHH